MGISMFSSKSSSVKACILLEIFFFSADYFVFSFDLKSGYHHVDIFPDHRKFLAFSWHFGTNCVRYFQFTVLAFGLSSALFIFTKLIKPLEAFWRLQGIPTAIFFSMMVSALAPLAILRNLTVLSSAQVSLNAVF